MQVSELSPDRRERLYTSRIIKHTEDCNERCLCGKYAWVYDGQGVANRDVSDISLLLVRHKSDIGRKTWSLEIRIPYARLVLALENYYTYTTNT